MAKFLMISTGDLGRDCITHLSLHYQNNMLSKSVTFILLCYPDNIHSSTPGNQIRGWLRGKCACEFQTCLFQKKKSLKCVLRKLSIARLFLPYNLCVCMCALKHTCVHTSHSHLQPLFQSDLNGFERLNFVAYNVEVYFYNYTLQGYSCTLCVWTCDLGCITEQFTISFFPSCTW